MNSKLSWGTLISSHIYGFLQNAGASIDPTDIYQSDCLPAFTRGDREGLQNCSASSSGGNETDAEIIDFREVCIGREA